MADSISLDVHVARCWGARAWHEELLLFCLVHSVEEGGRNKNNYDLFIFISKLVVDYY